MAISPRRVVAAVEVAVAAAGLLMAATLSALSTEPAAGPLPVVYVSGLDDHLLPAYESVPVHESPGGRVIGFTPVDVLARVHGEKGEWLDIELIGAELRGWVADYYLRAELHVVNPGTPGCPVDTSHAAGDPPHHQLHPSTRVRLLDAVEQGSYTWVLVRSLLTDGISWVDRAVLSERPGPDIRRAATGTACGDILPEPVVPHTH